ncbi:unnamed protein product [Closterium sp. Naga37s-1]|nr:unnamed protein product [Closterium sp. Naga37s-1]
MLAAFLAALVFFHSSEFLLALWSTGKPDLRSFLLSREYLLAMAAALTEYALETALFPAFKRRLWPVAWVGGALLLAGEAVRKAAMVTAGRSFTHDIQTEKRREHRLVTHGLYRWVRHPGYTGWFMWSIATQLLLVNPLCTLAFALVSWRFFAVRIPYEEFYLHQFFGLEYARYAASVPSGIPFVSDTCLEIIRLNALAAETPFRRPLSRPSLPVALSLSALFPSPPFPSRSLSPLPSHRALSLRSLPVALSPVALSLPPPLPSRSLSPLPSRRPLSRRPLSHRPRSLLRSVPSPSLPSPSLPSPSLPSPSLSLLLCPVALSPVALSPVALYLSRRPRSVPSPTLSPVAPALSRRLAKFSAVS